MGIFSILPPRHPWDTDDTKTPSFSFLVRKWEKQHVLCSFSLFLMADPKEGVLVSWCLKIYKLYIIYNDILTGYGVNATQTLTIYTKTPQILDGVLAVSVWKEGTDLGLHNIYIISPTSVDCGMIRIPI